MPAQREAIPENAGGGRGPGKRENGKTADSEDAERTELCAGAGRREHRKRIRKFCVKIKWRK